MKKILSCCFLLLITLSWVACHKKQADSIQLEKSVSENMFMDMESDIYPKNSVSTFDVMDIEDNIYPNNSVSTFDSVFYRMDKEVYSNRNTKDADKSLRLNYDTHIFEVIHGKMVREELDRTPDKILVKGVFNVENNRILCRTEDNRFFTLKRLTSEKIINYDIPYLEDTLYIVSKKLPKKKYASIIHGRWEDGKKDGPWVISDGIKRTILFYHSGNLISEH